MLDATLERQTERADELEARVQQLELLARAHGLLPYQESESA